MFKTFLSDDLSDIFCCYAAIFIHHGDRIPIIFITEIVIYREHIEVGPVDQLLVLHDRIRRPHDGVCLIVIRRLKVLCDSLEDECDLVSGCCRSGVRRRSLTLEFGEDIRVDAADIDLLSIQSHNCLQRRLFGNLKAEVILIAGIIDNFSCFRINRHGNEFILRAVRIDHTEDQRIYRIVKAHRYCIVVLITACIPYILIDQFGDRRVHKDTVNRDRAIFIRNGDIRIILLFIMKDVVFIICLVENSLKREFSKKERSSSP